MVLHNLSNIFIIVGILIALISNIWVVICAFRVSYGWGFVCMLFGWIGPLLLAFEEWKIIKVPLI
jgi:hypothetical protein